MKKFRVYFATKVHVTHSWFRRKKDVSETEYVVVVAHNEAHAHKEAKKHVDINALGMPFQVTHITPAPVDEAEGYHGTVARLAPPSGTDAEPSAEAPANASDDTSDV